MYVAPERLENESFLSLISHIPVSLLAVDEAHCISQWGQDFRPSYLKIADFIAQLPTRPVVAAFTATATKQVRADIISQLGLRNPLLNITGFDRPNLYFAVQHPTSKLAAVWQLVREQKRKIRHCLLQYKSLRRARVRISE
ncbi:MAG: DEAD/DEAH box helicase [Oscillospiraceae bacterium]